ncbi:MAG: hypothetical protein U0900_05405 [Myxococcota bacterium]
MTRFRFEIRGAWDGGPLEPGESGRIDLFLGDALEIELEAPRYGDPPPPTPPGRCDGLWDFEVLELFLLGRDDHYLELEFGPAGHWLALRLEGRRRVVSSDLGLALEVGHDGALWRARTRVPLGWLPAGLHAANAYAIHGVGAARRYLAWAPVPGPQPDFHRLECFPPLERARRPGPPER